MHACLTWKYELKMIMMIYFLFILLLCVWWYISLALAFLLDIDPTAVFLNSHISGLDTWERTQTSQDISKEKFWFHILHINIHDDLFQVTSKIFIRMLQNVSMIH